MMGVHDRERMPGRCGGSPKCARSGLVGRAPAHPVRDCLVLAPLRLWPHTVANTVAHPNRARGSVLLSLHLAGAVMDAVPGSESGAPTELGFEGVPAKEEMTVLCQRGVICHHGMPNSISQGHAEPRKAKTSVSSMGIYCVRPQGGRSLRLAGKEATRGREAHLAPAGNAEQACLRASRLCAEPGGPGPASPFPL